MALDPRAQTLTKAIALQEGGGKYLPYTSKSGDVPNASQAGGRYQFMPKTWSNYAGQVLGNSNAPMTPENQNQVAYTKVHEWLKKGYTPAQVASMWNAGENAPNAWKPGTKQAHGNTPQYVANVQKYGQELTKQNAPQTAQPQVSASTGLPQAVMPGNVQQPNNLPQAVMPQTQAPTQTQLPQPTGGLLGALEGIGKGAYGALTTLEKPFIGVGAIPTQLLAKALGRPDPFAQGIPNVEKAGQITPLNVEKKAGDLAQVGSYFIPGSGALGAAGMGVLQGAGQAMSKGAGLGTIAGEGAIGGALGGAVGGASKLLGYGLQKLGNGLTGIETATAMGGLRKAYQKFLNLNASELRLSKVTGKDITKVLVDLHAPLGRTPDGRLDANVAIDKIKEAIAPLNQQAKDILDNASGAGTNTSLQDVLKSVEKRIGEATMKSEDKASSINTARNSIGAEINAYGNNINPATLDTIKQGFAKGAFSSKMSSREKLQNNVDYVISSEIRKAEEQAVKGTPAGAEFGKLNAKRGEFIDTLHTLEKLNEVRKLPGGKMGHLFGGLAGAVIGTHSGGILGGITGDYFGTKASEFLNNPASHIALEEAKLRALKRTVGVLGRTVRPVGRGLTGLGNVFSAGARGAGLISTSNLSGK